MVAQRTVMAGQMSLSLSLLLHGLLLWCPLALGAASGSMAGIANTNNDANNNDGGEDIHFRVDFGTDGFIHQGGSKPGLSEKEKFIARMNAARAPKTKENSWQDDYETVCSSSAYLDAESMPFDPSDPHPGWAWAAERLDACQRGPYPGGFTADEDAWRLLRVDFERLAEPVRRYYEAHPENGMMCVVDGVAFFPPGVVLEWAPLFASQMGEGEECGGRFGDLERYGRDVGGERVAGGIGGKVETADSVGVKVIAHLMRRKGEKDEL